MSSAPSPLSPRESEVARRIAEGKRNKEIASELGISVRTVEAYVERICDKLGMSGGRSRTLIAVRWVRDDLEKKSA